MKRLLTTLTCGLLLATASHAQTFWTENFESGSSSGLEVNSYTGPNGSWTLTTSVSTAEGDTPNPWYVSCAEAGHTAGVCGTDCTSSAGLGATLHIGSNSGSFAGGDLGASYDAGGFCGFFYCTGTDRRAESPTINCTGKSSISMRFYYIENGDGATDDGTVWYSPDNGSTWSLLENTPKTSTCSSGQGMWAQHTIALPASANNNANVKIGFRWVNNDDGAGTDPSFAIDSITLSTSATVPTPTFTVTSTSACQDSCITFTSTTTGVYDSLHWAVVGAIMTVTTNPLVLCFPSSAIPAGTYVMRLYVFKGGAVDSASMPFTINPAPHPPVTKSGHTLTAPAGYTSYQWYNGSTAIGGATNNTYTYTTPPGGSYSVVVDSAGCKGTSVTFNTVGVSSVNGSSMGYWLTEQSGNMTVHAIQPASDPIHITVYDITGRKTEERIWQSGSLQQELNTAHLPSGLYVVRLEIAEGTVVLKWMK